MAAAVPSFRPFISELGFIPAHKYFLKVFYLIGVVVVFFNRLITWSTSPQDSKVAAYRVAFIF